MATKLWSATFLDPALNVLKTANKLVFCSTEPTTYTESNVTYMLAYATLSGADFIGPTNGRASGRKLVIGEVTATVDYAVVGTAYWFSFLDTSTSRLLYVGRVPDPPMLDSEVADTFISKEIEIEIQDM